jgi:hypothetical protein
MGRVLGVGGGREEERSSLTCGIEAHGIGGTRNAGMRS